jgi:hypothetical protein
VTWTPTALRSVARLLPLALALLLGAPATGPAPVIAASTAFQFNWTSSPTAPQDWVPGAVNDWDLITNINAPTDRGGTMQAAHGADCAAPPATHAVVDLADSAYLCKNHMMTAIRGGGDAPNSYGAVYFSPAQMLDFSQGQAMVSWQVSTYRSSARDYWEAWITPFDENLVVPVGEQEPAYAGFPRDAVHIEMGNTLCRNGQPNSLGVINGSPEGTDFTAEVINNFQATEVPTRSTTCMEDTVPVSATTRSAFELDVSQNHLRFLMPGTQTVWVDAAINLPFTRGVVQFAHQSYNPDKQCPLAPACAGTYHWSNISISPAAPFTMLRPTQPHSLHEGASNAPLTLPQPAPGNSFLRFAAMAQGVQVSFDGGRIYRAAQVQPASRNAPPGFLSYWTPIPTGTTSVTVKGIDYSNLPWWVEDVSVWSQGFVPGTQHAGQAAPAPAPSGPAWDDTRIGRHEMQQGHSISLAGVQAPSTGASGLRLLASNVRAGAPWSFLWLGLSLMVVLAMGGAALIGLNRVLVRRRRSRLPAPRP